MIMPEDDDEEEDYEEEEEEEEILEKTIPKRQIKKFDIHSLKAERTLVLLGARATGKSVLSEKIFSVVSNQFDIGFGMTRTHDTAKNWQKYIADSLIYNNGVDKDELKNIVEGLRALTETEDASGILKVFGILDDVTSDAGMLKTDVIKDIYNNGRHYHIFFVLLMQYLVSMGPEIRGQVDYWFVMRNTV